MQYLLKGLLLVEFEKVMGRLSLENFPSSHLLPSFQDHVQYMSTLRIVEILFSQAKT